MGCPQAAAALLPSPATPPRVACQACPRTRGARIEFPGLQGRPECKGLCGVHGESLRGRCRLARRHRRSSKVTTLLLFSGLEAGSRRPGIVGGGGGKVGRVDKICQPRRPSCRPAGCAGIAKARASLAPPVRLPRAPGPYPCQGAAIFPPSFRSMQVRPGWRPDPRASTAGQACPILRARGAQSPQGGRA